MDLFDFLFGAVVKKGAEKTIDKLEEQHHRKHALIGCPDCGEKISKTADVCPFCGAELQKYKNKQGLIDPELYRKAKRTRLIKLSICVPLFLLSL